MPFPLTSPPPPSRSIRLGSAILLLASVWTLPRAAGESEPAPHVILIAAENLGHGEVGSQGSRKSTASHLDSLATRGARLTRFYAAADPGPALAGLLTGRYHYRTGASGSTHGEGIFHAHEVTLAEIFRARGRATGCFGAWYSGVNWPHCPEGRGFGRHQYADTPDATVDLALTFLDDALGSDQRLFCQLVFGAPARVADIDAATGRLLSWLEDRGIAGETLVWFLSTNGPETVAAPSDNAYLRGARGSVHEGGVRVPSLVRWPGKIPPGTEFRRLTAQIDVLPTLLDICGIDTGEVDLPPLDGMSLAPALLSGGQPDRWPNRILFTSWTPPGYDTKNASVAVRTDRWLAIRDPRWRRGTLSETHSGWELYDLNADPYERTDHADDYPFLLSDMRADFSRWMDHTTDDGLGAIPAEIGHREWPVVTLRREDATFHPADPPDRLTWPVKTIADMGHLRVRVVSSEVGGRFILGIGERIYPFTLDPAERDLGAFAFPEGEYDITLTPAESGGPPISIQSITLAPAS